MKQWGPLAYSYSKVKKIAYLYRSGYWNSTAPGNFIKINLRNRLVAHIFATEWFLNK